MNTTPTHEDPDVKKMFSDLHQRQQDIRARIKADRLAGKEALCRLLPIARGCTGQSERVARILLGLYNGYRFPLDLTNLRSLDYEILDDCLAVMRMDSNAYQEVHLYFDNGGEVFEQLAKDWGFEKKQRARA